MSECRLLEENGRRHFMTRRFDRLAGGEKPHLQSLCAPAHFDSNQAGAYACEQALRIIRQLNLPMPAMTLLKACAMPPAGMLMEWKVRTGRV